MDRPFPAYSGEEPHLFVSYSHLDSLAVFPELIWLREKGINIWYDEGIKAGSEWRQEIGTAIKSASVFLYFVSPESVLSENCRREVSFADKEKIPIIAVHLRASALPEGLDLTLSDRQAIFRYQLSREKYREKLISGITDNLHGNRPMVPLIRPAVLGFYTKYAPISMIALVMMVGGYLLLVSKNDNPVNLPADETSAVTQDPSDARPDMLKTRSPSIAVLPFVNISGDVANEYFSDGLSGELLSLLAAIKELHVVARTSSFAYKGKDLDVRELGRLLNVQHVRPH